MEIRYTGSDLVSIPDIKCIAERMEETPRHFSAYLDSVDYPRLDENVKSIAAVDQTVIRTWPPWKFISA